MGQTFYHEKIPELRKFKKTLESYKHQGIALWPSMAPAIYYYHHYKSMGSAGSQFARMLKFLFFKETFHLSNQTPNKILASFLIDRKDHHNIWKQALTSFQADELITIDAFRQGKRDLKSIAKRFSFHFPNLFTLYNIWRQFKKTNIASLINKKSDYWYLLLHAYYQTKKINYWKPIITTVKPKAYIAYSSYRNNDETILTQLTRKQGVPTFTFQNYSLTEFKNFNYESITYENFISDYFLLWGETGKRTMKKFLQNKQLILTGNPLYTNITKRKTKTTQPKTCTIFLDHNIYEKSNTDMLKHITEISQKFPAMKFYVKMHPDNNEQFYKEKIKGENFTLLEKTADKGEWLKKTDILIVHNTTIALEALRYQIPIFRYKDSTFFEMSLPEYTFSDVGSLETLFKKACSVKEYNKLAKEYYLFYLQNFHQPSKGTISQNYKKQILSRIR